MQSLGTKVIPYLTSDICSGKYLKYKISNQFALRKVVISTGPEIQLYFIVRIL